MAAPPARAGAVIVALSAALGLVFGLVLGTHERSAIAQPEPRRADVPVTVQPNAEPAIATPGARSSCTAPETRTVPVDDAPDGTEVGAVIETNRSNELVADTPLGEEVAARELARAFSAVVHTDASPAALAVLWAQWAHETARGRRMHGYNFAGIKGRGPSGASVVVWTREGRGTGELVKRTFRAYRTPAEGARDYLDLLASRYPSALRAARAGDVVRFVNALDSGGYFTADSQDYLRALTSLSLECLRRGLAAAPAEPSPSPI